MNLLLYALVVLIWGSTWIAITLQTGEVPVAVSVFYRFALATGLMGSALWLAGRLSPLSRRQHLVCMQLGALLFCCNFLCFYSASMQISSGMLSLVFSMASLFNVLLLWLGCGQRPEPRAVHGALLGLLGLGAIFLPDLARDSATVAGLLLALCGTLLFSLGNIVSSRQPTVDLPSSTAWAMGYGTLFLGGYILFSGTPLSIDTRPSYLAALLYLAVAGSVIGFTAYLLLVRRIGPAQAAYATALFPVIALGLSTWLEGYQWHWQAMVGVVLIVAGNLMVFGHRNATITRLKAADPGTTG